MPSGQSGASSDRNAVSPQPVRHSPPAVASRSRLTSRVALAVGLYAVVVAASGAWVLYDRKYAAHRHETIMRTVLEDTRYQGKPAYADEDLARLQTDQRDEMLVQAFFAFRDQDVGLDAEERRNAIRSVLWILDRERVPEAGKFRGIALREGLLGEKDTTGAVSAFQRAIEELDVSVLAGDPAAMIVRAGMLDEGLGTPPDRQAARRLLVSAVERVKGWRAADLAGLALQEQPAALGDAPDTALSLRLARTAVGTGSHHLVPSLSISAAWLIRAPRLIGRHSATNGTAVRRTCTVLPPGLATRDRSATSATCF